MLFLECFIINNETLWGTAIDLIKQDIISMYDR